MYKIVNADTITTDRYENNLALLTFLYPISFPTNVAAAIDIPIEN